jgi:anti-sigma B factor antagonist
MTESEGPLAISNTANGLAVSGEIDAHTAPTLAEAIDSSDVSELEVDLSAVEFVDSSGLRVLIDAHQRADADGRVLRLARPSAAVRRLFEISGVDDYLHVVE